MGTTDCANEAGLATVEIDSTDDFDGAKDVKVFAHLEVACDDHLLIDTNFAAVGAHLNVAYADLHGNGA